MSIKTISSREVYRNRWTRVREDVVERSNGQRGIYGVIDKDPASIVIPLEVTEEGEFVYLIEQFRYTVGERHSEFPQGGWERSDVVPEDLARGELREETGLTAERMTHLSTLQIAYGVMNQKQYVFLAEGLTLGAHDRDDEETDQFTVDLERRGEIPLRRAIAGPARAGGDGAVGRACGSQRGACRLLERTFRPLIWIPEGSDWLKNTLATSGNDRSISSA